MTPYFSYQYQLFPNTSLTFDSRHIELWQILPDGPAGTEVVHTAYMRPGLPDEERQRLAEMAPWICETVVDGEDFWVGGAHRAGAAHRAGRDRALRAQRAGAAAPPPGLRLGAGGRPRPEAA